MRKTCLPLAILCCLASTLGACLSNNGEETVIPTDAAVSSFVLGTLNMYIHTTTSDGRDSVYKANLKGSSFAMHIDQEQGLIYNTDSLPVETDVRHVVCTINSYAGGRAVWKSVTSDSLKTHNAADSIDFSKPRELRVLSPDGSRYRTYIVTLNVHKQKPDDLHWQKKATETAFVGMKEMKALSCNGKIFVLGVKDGNTTIYTSDINDGMNWRLAQPNFNTVIPEEAMKNAVVKNDRLMLLVGNLVMQTADGDVWQQTGTLDNAQLVAASATQLYAIDSNQRLLMSADNGNTWTTDLLDTDALWLPATDLTSVTTTLKTNTDIERVILAGNREASAYPNDTKARLWAKIIQTGKEASSTWMFFENTQTTNCLPRLKGLSMIACATDLIALGYEAGTENIPPTLSSLYTSMDGGVNWQREVRFSLPDGLPADPPAFALTADKNNYIWIVSAKDGQVWKGRLNRWGWTSAL